MSSICNKDQGNKGGDYFQLKCYIQEKAQVLSVNFLPKFYLFIHCGTNPQIIKICPASQETTSCPFQSIVPQSSHHWVTSLRFISWWVSFAWFLTSCTWKLTQYYVCKIHAYFCVSKYFLSIINNKTNFLLVFI